MPHPWDRRIAPAALALAGLALAGCGGEAERRDSAITVTDGAGRSVHLAAPARRVVSLIPALTDWVVALGAADRLVARTDYDRDLALRDVPSVGGGLDPSIEWLAAQDPDLVLAWPDIRGRSLVERLDGLGIAVYTAPTQTIEHGLAAAADLGRLLGLGPEADRAVARVRDELDRVARARPDTAPDVLFLIGLDPIMAAGPGTFVHELIQVAGGRNVIGDLGTLWPGLSLEEVVRRAPDVVILASAGTRDPRAALGVRPGWRDVPAVRAGRVHGVDPDLTNRPGPHMPEAAAELARLIHGAP